MNPSQIYKKVKGQMQLVECQLLYNLAKESKFRGIIVEIGSYKGLSTACLAFGSLEGNKAKVYAIDPHLEYDSEKEFKENIAKLNLTSIVTPFVMTSEEAAKIINEPVKLIFIDGDHSYEAVKKDFELWFPKMAPGGVMAFHDSQFFDGVRKLTREKIYKSKAFREVGLVDSITFATYSNATIADRLGSRLKLLKKDLYYVGVWEWSFQARIGISKKEIWCYSLKLKLPRKLREIGKSLFRLYVEPSTLAPKHRTGTKKASRKDKWWLQPFFLLFLALLLVLTAILTWILTKILGITS
jgi:predicted O-methyltransferase YrrM